MARTSFQLDDEVNDAVESRLSYGDSKSEWYRHAVKMRLQVDPMLDELFESYQNEERIEFIEKAVQEKIEREKEANGN